MKATVYELIDTNNAEYQHKEGNAYFIAKNKKTQHAKFLSIFGGAIWETSTVRDIVEDEDAATIFTSNSEYKFAKRGQIEFDTFKECVYSNEGKNRCEYRGLLDAQKMYKIGDNLAISMIWFSHIIDEKGAEGYYPEPDSLAIVELKEGETEWNRDTIKVLKTWPDCGDWGLICDLINHPDADAWEYYMCHDNFPAEDELCLAN